MKFTEKDVEQIQYEYCISAEVAPKAEELIVITDNGDPWSYNGAELFLRDGKLWENYCGHCSCYGCEGQWEPIEVLLAAIKMRPAGFSGIPYEEVEASARAAGYLGE